MNRAKNVGKVKFGRSFLLPMTYLLKSFQKILVGGTIKKDLHCVLFLYFFLTFLFILSLVLSDSWRISIRFSCGRKIGYRITGMDWHFGCMGILHRYLRTYLRSYFGISLANLVMCCGLPGDHAAFTGGKFFFPRSLMSISLTVWRI